MSGDDTIDMYGVPVPAKDYASVSRLYVVVFGYALVPADGVPESPAVERTQREWAVRLSMELHAKLQEEARFPVKQMKRWNAMRKKARSK